MAFIIYLFLFGDMCEGERLSADIPEYEYASYKTLNAVKKTTNSIFESDSFPLPFLRINEFACICDFNFICSLSEF